MGSVQLAIGAEVDIASGSEVKESEDRIIGAVKGAGRRDRPIPHRVPGSGDANHIVDFQGPQAGELWEIKGFTISVTDDSRYVVAASSTNAGAAAGTAALPAGAWLSGFDINFVQGAAAANGVVTVTNTDPGTLSYEVVCAVTNGSNLSVHYPNPIPALTPAVAPTVSVPAIVGGSAYTINAYGVMAAALYVGDRTHAGTFGDLVWPGTPLGEFQKVRSAVWAHNLEHVYAVVYGVPDGAVMAGVLHVNRWTMSAIARGL